LEEDIKEKYVPKWFKSIGVTVTPMERYYFVGGQVNKPDAIRYTGPTTLSGAIQAAGDFTPFANKRKIQVTHEDNTIEYVNFNKALKNPKLDIPIRPHDRIFVPRRF
jgi:polysaccharide export outer membrane protein